MILHFLRHVSVCLWIALLIGGLGSFLILLALQPTVGVDAAPLLAAGLLTAGFAAAAWTANRLGLGRVRRLMRRADRAERDGLRKDAERAFQRALGVLDSFWVSPRARRRTLLPLAGRIARYYLSESRLGSIAEDFIARYLWACPGDAEVAEQWVQHVERRGGLREEHQDLGDRLADAHPHRPLIQMAVARLCLAAERTDYAALQTYRRACSGDGAAPAEFCADLERLFRRDGRTDEWARQAFRRAGNAVPATGAPPTRKPPAPSQRRAPDEDLKDFTVSMPADEEEAAFRMAPAAGEAEGDEEEARVSLIAEPRRPVVGVRALARRGVAGLLVLRDRIRRWGKLGLGQLAGVWRYPGMRRALTLSLILGAGIGGGWLVLSRIDVFESAPPSALPVSLPSSPAPVAAADQFALQVAAYLRQDYALKLVEDLKKKGLKAYSVETASSGKTWYQVRIAPFPDPQAAREFGRDLKWRGVIDDFYVTSASR
jgi:hypothetical protein